MPTLLALETSCDESAAAVVRDQRVLASAVASQVEEHARWGGVVPEIASRAHLEQINGVIAAALDDAGMTLDEVRERGARDEALASRAIALRDRIIAVVGRESDDLETLAVEVFDPPEEEFTDHVRAHRVGGEGDAETLAFANTDTSSFSWVVPSTSSLPSA